MGPGRWPCLGPALWAFFTSVSVPEMEIGNANASIGSVQVIAEVFPVSASRRSMRCNKGRAKKSAKTNPRRMGGKLMAAPPGEYNR